MDIMKNMIKKSILLFCLLFGIMFCVNAQTTKYYSTDFAYKVKNDYGQWSDWSKWESSRCLITISLDRNVINIYSEEPQEFDIYDSEGNVTDSDGESLILNCVDKNGLRCAVRLRVQNNGIFQLYVEYNDVIFVYCIEKRN